MIIQSHPQGLDRWHYTPITDLSKVSQAHCRKLASLVIESHNRVARYALLTLGSGALGVSTFALSFFLDRSKKFHSTLHIVGGGLLIAAGGSISGFINQAMAGMGIYRDYIQHCTRRMTITEMTEYAQEQKELAKKPGLSFQPIAIPEITPQQLAAIEHHALERQQMMDIGAAMAAGGAIQRIGILARIGACLEAMVPLFFVIPHWDPNSIPEA